MSDFTFSEHGEDILIHRLLLWQENGFYIDCGAYHARRMSLTARLRSFGWTGMNIDIDEEVVGSLKKDIPGSVAVCAAIGSDDATVNFYKYKDSVLNTTDPAQHQHLQLIEGRGELFTSFVGARKVNTRSVASILDEYQIPEGAVDFLNLDIEGVELIALEGFPWGLQTPKVIAVEIHRLNLERCGANPIVNFLFRKGYVLQSYVFHTAIFCRSDFDTELCHRVSAKTL